LTSLEALLMFVQDREATSTRTTAAIALEQRPEVRPERQSSRRSST